MSMRDQVLGLPAQLRAGSTMPLPTVPGADVVLFVGMGGSGMAAQIGAMVVSESGINAAVHRGYGLPAWARTVRPLVIAVSYSGETEEVLSAVGTATDLDLPVGVVAGGGGLLRLAGEHGFPAVAVPTGLQPRAALGFQVAAVLRLLEGADIVADTGPMLDAAATAVEQRLADDAATAREIASALAGLIPVVYGSGGVPAAAARRWQNQINENAKQPAFAGEIPEMNHNQLEGWRPGAAGAAFGFVLLSSPSDHPRIRIRHDLTAEILAASGMLAGRVVASGSTVLEQTFTLVAVGDLVSVELASEAGIDATPVATLQSFKQRLAEA